ncbi:response regulator transcription factor [Leucobacter sp. VD1]|uniref:response regulator transcription factor n=1 Tax=Leucobacter sp. VD1 TaxID=3080381 RepID=UPI00301A56F4
MEPGWARRVLLVEDQAVLRTLTRELFEQRGFEVCSAATGVEALAAFDAFDPDVLVADIDLGARPDGAELAEILRARAPHLGVVFLSSYPRAAARAQPFGLADAVFLSKAAIGSADELVAAVEGALGSSAGDVFGDGPGAGADAVSGAAKAGGGNGIGSLTRHQLRVLSMVARGWSNEQIAEQSGAGLRAVERSVSRIFERLEVSGDRGVNARVAAAAQYLAEFGPVR